MVTVVRSEAVASKVVDGVTTSRSVYSFVGLPGDTKPTGQWKGILIGNGSKYLEIGGSRYSYDEENDVWIEDAGSGSGSSDSSSGGPTLAEVLQLIILATGNTPIARTVVEDAAETELEIENWDTEYVVPGTSLETLTITLPETTPTALSSCIKVTILSTALHADPEDESNDPLMLPPTIILPEGLVIVGGYPEAEGDRWVLTIDENMTATAMVIPNPPAEEQEGGE